MNKYRAQSGFTIIEITIAIAFIAMLLMAIITLTLTAGKMYVKGSANKAVNQSGRDISDTIRQDFLDTGMGSITIVPNATSVNGAVSGRMCLGPVVYLWNSAALLNSTVSGSSQAQVTVVTNGAQVSAHLVRIAQATQSYCTKNAQGAYPLNVTEPATELLGGSGRDYALYTMTVTPVAKSGDSGMYELTYTIGTNEAGTTQLSGATSGFTQCKPNNTVGADFDYCSVADFDMMVRVGGAQQ